MITMTAQRHTLANALRVAAERYKEDAASYVSHEYPGGENTRLRAMFLNQEKAARALADAIEQADSIRLED